MTEKVIESPKTISIVIALIAGIVSGILSLLFFGIKADGLLLQCLAVALSTFTVILIASNLLINYFVAKKIRPLYKTLYYTDVSDSHLASKVDE
ncbi:MAG TPA: hypothetical protein PLH91_08805, partial [Tenuifilaceae bacterium]|nr:hypothetical protein [Tenuifilaceae bacterium]